MNGYAIPDFHKIDFNFWLSSQRIDIDHNQSLSQNINHTRIL